MSDHSLSITAPAQTWANVLGPIRKHCPDGQSARLRADEQGDVFAEVQSEESTFGLVVPAAHVQGVGEIYFDAGHLRDTAKTMGGEHLEVSEAEGEKVCVRGSDFEATRMPPQVTGHISRPDVEVVATRTWETDLLRGAIQRALPATSSDPLKAELSGIRLDLPNGQAVATDKKRLSHVDLGVDMEWTETLPETGCERLLDVLPENGEAEVQLGERGVRLEWEAGWFYVRLVSATGEFPAYESALPSTEKGTRFRCRRKDLVRAVQRVRLYAGEWVRLEHDCRSEAEHSSLRVGGRELEAGLWAVEEVPLTDIDGPYGEPAGEFVHVDPAFLIEQLRSFGAEVVEVRMRGPKQMVSVVPSPEANDGETAGHVMPMTVDGMMEPGAMEPEAVAASA